MHLESEDLVQQFAHDWPDQFERSQLRLLVDRLTEQNEQLQSALAHSQAAQEAPVSATAAVRPYVQAHEEASRHG